MIGGGLRDVVDAAWAEALGCDPRLLGTPGSHLVGGGPGFEGYNAVYMARFDDSVLVYCPDACRVAARRVLAGCPAGDVFTARTLMRIAGDQVHVVLGPSSHGFADADSFVPLAPEGQRVSAGDDRLAALRRACGEEEWAEAGFHFDRGVAYVMERDGRVVVAGNMTPFRDHFADVGLVTHPDHRGRGWAKRLASRMIADVLPDAEVVRYRALTTNAPSVAVARSLGFLPRGENLVARLRGAPG